MCIQISGVIQTQVEEIYAEMTAEKVLWKRRDALRRNFQERRGNVNVGSNYRGYRRQQV